MHLTPVLTRRRVVAVGAASALLAGVTASVTTADAADPTSGAVSPTASSTSWTGGPFLVSNVTGTAGDVDCSVPTSCDDFTLTVDTPAGYGTGHSLRISTSWANTASDFDVYLIDSAGREVAAAASSADPEVILTAPEAGTYTVRIVPFAVAGDSYSASASLVDVPTPPAPSSAPASGFTTYGAPESLPDAHDAGEPSIGYDWKTDAAMYQSYLSTYRTTFDDSTSPATAHFTDVSASAANGCPGGSTTSLDPILATERDSGRTIESQLLDVRAAGSLSCVTSDAGQSWTTSQGGGLLSAVDHQTLGWGPYAPGGAAATRLFDKQLYYCSQDIAEASCSTSSDGGITFGPALPMYDLTQCGGLHGHVKVARDGTAYVPNKSCNGHPAVLVSTDNGLSWSIRTVPDGTSGESDPSVGVADDGTVYLGWNGADNHAYTAVSRDRGRTWSAAQDVGAQVGVVNTVFPAAVAGDADRAAVAFIGTTTAGNSSETDVFPGVWQLYVASTFDGGRSWRTTNATGTDPVQRGSICTGGTTCGNDRNLLDFIDATVDPQGRVLVGFADGCTADCVGTTSPTSGTSGYRDAYATIARQSSGLRMFAADDPAPDLTVGSLQAGGSGSSTRVSALVTNAGGSTAGGVTVAFSTDRKAIGTTSPVTLAPGASQRVGVAWKGAGSGGTVTAVVDPDGTIAESDEANNKAVASVSTR